MCIRDRLSSYRVDTSDEGIVIHKRLRMGTAEGFMLSLIHIWLSPPTIRITGNLKVGGDSLHIGGRQLLRYDADKATATINASHIDFLDATCLLYTSRCV